MISVDVKDAISISEVLQQAKNELLAAVATHQTLHSAHEGYSVILEELDELWDEVKKNRSQRRVPRMREEAIQVAAMALRFVLDVCQTEHGVRNHETPI